MGLLGISKKGKWIIGGVCAFAVVATATTGLAAWVIGQNTGATGSGNITVEKNVTDTSITLAVTSTESDLTVKFGPKNGNYTVVNATDTNKTEEKLDFTISGTYTKKSESATISKVGAELVLGEDAANLVTEGYIAAPVEAVEGKYTLTDMNVTANDSDPLKGTFTGTYSFKWGSKFGGMNPCEYFDGSEGKGYTEASTALTALSTLTSPASFTVTLTVK